MSKEIYISSTPHETRLAIVEEEALSEIYYERENEYTLAGSIYNGRVTRVLPGMQSAFVDIGLDRDAFLYITDFLEEAADPEEFDTSAPRQSTEGERGGRGRRGGRDRQTRNGSSEIASLPERDTQHNNAARSEADEDEGELGGAPPSDEIGQGAPGADGSRRWRGRRGRRRGRGAQGVDAARPNTRELQPETENEAISAPEGFESQNDPAAAEKYGERQGRGDRGDQGRGDHERGRQPARFPRGFAPSRSELYGIRNDDSEGTGPVEDAYPDLHASAEPIVLPGESLSKYRKDGGQTETQPAAALGSPDTAQASFTPLARPATLYTEVATGWDGGAVLPGETLSRGSSKQRPQFTSRATAPIQAPEQREESQAPRSFAAEAVPEAVSPAAETAPSSFEQHAQPVEIPVDREYEPENASASFRVDPVPPREFRNVPVMEPIEPQIEAADNSAAEGQVSAPAAEVVAHDVTSISPAGEMLSEPAPIVDNAANSSTAVGSDETSPILHEHAIDSAEDFETESPSELESLPAEPETTTLQASSIEEIDDEDEVLEGTADLGVMLREMSIDQITRHEPESDELEEEALEELEEYESPRAYDHPPQEDLDETDSAQEADEYEYSGSNDEEEPSSEAASTEPAPQREGERRGRRERRDGRRGRGDRHGHGNGRARHSVQSTNLPAISDLLKPGQEILVQIAKEPIAKKGARITSHIALPGRFLVFMPTVNHTGVSRKIDSDTERRRLKEILLSEKGEASGGFIVRTAAEGASEDELRSDLRFLLNLWSDIKARSDSSKSPALIYHDLNLIERILRDQVTDNFSAIWVDTETEYERVLRFLQRFQPSLIRRVKLYTKETPLFEQFGISDEINKALKSKVWLKSGGSIVINQTEALVAIDINTGKFVGKTARLEDTIVKTNLDAIPEIVRQIRLRDLGGIIIIDFIDMDERKNRNRVMAALEDELKKDRAPSKVLQFNDFGLVAITRKRVKQSLERTLSVPCAVCSGTGMVKSPVTVCNDIYIEMRKMQKHLDRGDVMLRVHPEVVKQLKASGAKWLQEMEDMVGKTILVKSDPSLHPEQFDIH